MIVFPNMHAIAAVALERMLYCLAEGSAVAAAVAIVLRLAPERNSRTRFVVWLATLAAVVLLPAVSFGLEIAHGAKNAVSGRALLTLSAAFAEYILLAWAVVAGLGLVRVASGLFQIRSLRRVCAPMSSELLGAGLQASISQFSRRRRVSILVSSRVEVPTAIGFFRPAVVIPAWLAAGADREELKYVLLHELAHLQRWDDWTNLAQKLVKAVLFFHPGVWWIERTLSLDREMACDDAVLAQTGSPRLYARCLARVAEKSFLRQQLVLAQAAVDRMRQLSLRVARILNTQTPRSTRLWKPAVPMVAMIALLCAISTSSAPNLVSVKDTQPLDARTSLGTMQLAKSSISPGSMLHMASLMTTTTGSPAAQASFTRAAQPKRRSSPTAGHAPSQKLATVARASSSPAGGRTPNPSYSDADIATSAPAAEGEAPSPRYGMVFVMMTQERIRSGGSVTWQVNMWELRLPAPEEHPIKPIPHKT